MDRIKGLNLGTVAYMNKPFEAEELLAHWVIASSTIPRRACSNTGLIDVDRFFEIQGDKLTLSTPTLIFDGIQGTEVLIWERLSLYNNSMDRSRVIA
jgi:DNA-binding response OmpR family regulator